jgi:tetratricopeptide (TPR) repeat protein/transcriptional regulator with XRE-family HTH domain
MTTRQPPSFGALLRHYRDVTGLTQEELAQKAGLSVPTISNLERGRSQTPYRATVRSLADALELSGEERAGFLAAALGTTPEPAARSDGPATRTGRPVVEGNFLGALPSKRLVGREEELARILGALDTATGEAGTGRLVLLAGEPGIGKTRLAQEVSVHAWERGFHVASGRCYEAHSGVPFYPFLEALGKLYEEAPEEARGRRPYLERLLPDHFPSQPIAAPSGDQEELHQLLRAVNSFVRDTAANKPVALFIDDLHWADEASLDLLQHLARQTRPDRVLLVGTYREVEVRRGHPLRKAVRDLGREQLVERVAVRRLGREETTALVAGRLDGMEVSEEFAGLVYGHTEGNPFFVAEVLEALIERGNLFVWEGRWVRSELDRIEVPESVREIIAERTSRLEPETQETLEEASVLGQRFAFDDLRAISDRDEEEVEEALEEALGAGLVRDIGEEHTFNHALTHQAIYADIARRRRRRLHLAAGEALERHTERVRRRRASEIARHFVGGKAPARALPYALLAGDRAEEVFAHSEAERHYRSALGLAEGVRDESETAQALEKLGGVLATTVRYDEALSVLERASDLRRAQNDLEATSRVEAAIARTHFRRGTPDEGTARLSAHLEALDRPDASQEVRRSLANLYVGLTRLNWAHRRFAGCRDAAERAAGHARAVDDLVLLSEAEMMRGTALHWLGVPDEALAALETSLALAEGPGPPAALVAAPLPALWLAYLKRGQFDLSHGYAERGAALAEKAGDRDLLAMHTAILGLQHFYAGDWRASEECLERAVGLSRGTRLTRYSYVPSAYLGVLRKAEGAWDEASRGFSEAVDLAREAGNGEGTRYAESRLAEMDVLQDRPAGAIARLGRRPDLSELTSFYEIVLLSALAEAHADTGDAAGAEEVADLALTQARRTRNRVDGVEALRVRAKILSMRGCPEEAAAALAEALSWASPMPYPYAEARLLHEYGMLHLREGEPERARKRLSAALGIFGRLGAKKDAERTEQALRALDPAR